MVTLIVLTVVGSIVGGLLVGYTLYTITRWPSADATVVRYRKARTGEGIFYHPVYRFVTLDGQSVLAISNWGSWRRPWPRGAIVPIRYSPSNPRRTEIQCFGNQWGIAATIVGMLAIGWIVWVAFG